MLRLKNPSISIIMLTDLLLFDETKPAPSIGKIMAWTLAILIMSNFIFLILTTVTGIKANKELETEKDIEYVEWNKRKLSPWLVLLSELANSTIYSPLAEESVFRFLLMKVVCTK